MLVLNIMEDVLAAVVHQDHILHTHVQAAQVHALFAVNQVARAQLIFAHHATVVIMAHALAVVVVSKHNIV